MRPNIEGTRAGTCSTGGKLTGSQMHSHYRWGAMRNGRGGAKRGNGPFERSLCCIRLSFSLFFFYYYLHVFFFAVA